MPTIETSYHGINDRFRIDIDTDDFDIESPRDWDNLGTMYCEHRRYNLGDRDADDPRDDNGRIDRKIAVWLPLYLYDHSGLSMNTGGFSDPWDSGCVGVIYVSRADVLKEYGVKRISKKLRSEIAEILRGEVSNYDSYLRGDCYAFTITDTKTDEIIGSCGGFLGNIEYCKSEAESELKAHIDNLNARVFPGVL